MSCRIPSVEGFLMRLMSSQWPPLSHGLCLFLPHCLGIQGPQSIISPILSWMQINSYFPKSMQVSSFNQFYLQSTHSKWVEVNGSGASRWIWTKIKHVQCTINHLYFWQKFKTTSWSKIHFFNFEKKTKNQGLQFMLKRCISRETWSSLTTGTFILAICKLICKAI